MSASYYTVEFVIVVDRPDRRDASFAPVEPGHRFHTRWSYHTRREAIAVYDSIIRGEHDFASEYVAWVVALERDCYEVRGARTVRRRVERRRKFGAGVCGAGSADCGHALCLATLERDRAEGLAPVGAGPAIARGLRALAAHSEAYWERVIGVPS